MPTFKLLIGTVALALLEFSYAGPREPEPPVTASSSNALKASALLHRQLARENAPVKSLQDFYAVQATTHRGIAAFHKLSASSRGRFIADLSFGERGLASYNFKVVEDELSLSEAHQLLSLFGVEHTLRLLRGLRVESSADQLVKNLMSAAGSCCDEGPEGGGDHKGYRCESRGTCVMSQVHICTDNC